MVLAYNVKYLWYIYVVIICILFIDIYYNKYILLDNVSKLYKTEITWIFQKINK